ncbi:hypothetical protein [Synechocystis sp. PCC 7509]|uniref:hypothetical protein n=1 Tax=Synechocystis sp. PCC 7509 TaxID=927677 RepID=UPI0002EEAD7E|nr:hypothetical protein [Synechocystis sp. PCC 7509]
MYLCLANSRAAIALSQLTLGKWSKNSSKSMHLSDLPNLLVPLVLLGLIVLAAIAFSNISK